MTESKLKTEEAGEKKSLLERAEKIRKESGVDSLDLLFQQQADRFNPEKELLEVKKKARESSFDKQERLQEFEKGMREFKRKLLEQKKGIARLQVCLEESIRDNPGEPEEFFEKAIQVLIGKYRLSERQEKLFKDAIAKYVEKHRTIAKYIGHYKSEYPEPEKHEGVEDVVPDWKKEFFKDMFGSYPKGPVKLEIGPMTILWRCKDFSDYALAYGGNEERAKKSRGRRLKKSKIKGLEGLVNLRNASINSKSPDEQGEVDHEELHTISDLFPQKKQEALELELGLKSTEKEIKQAITRLVRQGIEKFEMPAKHEILCYLKQGVDLDKIRGKLLKSQKEGGIYDYLSCKDSKGKNNKRWLIEGVHRILKKHCGTDKVTKNVELFAAGLEDVIGKEYDRYKQTVSRSIDDAKDIAQFFRHNKREMIYFLAQDELDGWGQSANLLWEVYLYDLGDDQLDDLLQRVENADYEKVVRLIRKEKRFRLKRKP